jgi:hypothetical protein
MKKKEINNKATNPHWGPMVGYGSFSLCVIHKEGLCPSIGNINGLMMNKFSEIRNSMATKLPSSNSFFFGIFNF